MTFRLEGFEDLERALAEVAKQSTRVAITRRALKRAAEPMRAKAAQYAPVDSGMLSDSIKISTRVVGEVGRAAYAKSMRDQWDAMKAMNQDMPATAAMKSVAVAAMRNARRNFKVTNPPAILYMGPTRNAWYAHFTEFGTAPHTAGGKFKGARHPGTAPDPYMRPAFDSEAGPTIDRLRPLLWDEIQRHAARMDKRAAKG